MSTKALAVGRSAPVLDQAPPEWCRNKCIRGGSEEPPLMQIQSRFRIMSYSISHATSNLRTYTFKGRARTPRSRAALQRYFRLAPIPNAFGELHWRTRPADSQEPGLRSANGARHHPRLQRARPGCSGGRLFASQKNPGRIRLERSRSFEGDAAPLPERVWQGH